MSNECVFCRIAAGLAPAAVVYTDEQVTAFRDIRPQARTHILIIPNQHLSSLNEVADVDPALLGRLLQVAADLAQREGIAKSGYRVLTNTGPDSGQSVDHLHLHLLGGNRLRMELG